MNKLIAGACIALAGLSLTAHGQEVISKKGYTLTYSSNDAAFSPETKEKLISTFFKVYPKLAKEYNPKTLRKVEFIVDTAYKGVAATHNGKVVYSPVWLKQHPGDIDVVTHEVMHIVQDYGRSVGPGWLTEGIADYVRWKFGVDNAAANWKLPELKPEHSYKNSYRITARFLAWIESKVKKGTVQRLDAALRDHSYTAALWKEQTGSHLDELWTNYVKNPQI
ncbi:basic secretory protein-like protein [Pedobacter sp. SYP-B3415]|uniref:basic secretory protein-like protein n=1 Tax=Pedobacter sp. SYP-B3415 TaxID=2496641 RepID=UPI00101CFC40|nr:basic secretory protein-like protein [Pedobacter sp. SYP-B3415]